MPTILIVEDENVLVTVLTNKLTRHGFSILQALDGEEAIKIIREKRPDLVLLDLVMPKKNGFQVLEEIKSDPLFAALPIVVFSNLNQSEDRERAKQLGAVDFLVKSDIGINDVVGKVQGYLGQRQKVPQKLP